LALERRAAKGSRLSALTAATDTDITLLTKGQQHLGMHINFGDVEAALVKGPT